METILPNIPDRLYLIELPGKSVQPLVVSAGSVSLDEGTAAFWKVEGIVTHLVAAFAPGRWMSVKLAVAKPKDGAAV